MQTQSQRKPLSSKDPRPISPNRADCFLSELVNLNWQPVRTKDGPPLGLEDEAAFTPFIEHRVFGRMLPGLPGEIPAWRRLQLWRDKLRLGWMQGSRDRKDWMTSLVHIYVILYATRRPSADPEELRAMLGEPTRPVDLESAHDPFLQVLRRASEVADRMYRCANPGCPHPLFFAQAKNQRYCTNACAAPAKREAKLKWWREHGDQRRKRRERKSRARAKHAPRKPRKEKQG